jgi:hypothetical protein
MSGAHNAARPGWPDGAAAIKAAVCCSRRMIGLTDNLV